MSNEITRPNDPILLPYQQDFVKTCHENRYVIVRKARQTGLSLAAALVACMSRLVKGSDCYYVSRTEKTASQFSKYCKTWAEVLNRTALSNKVPAPVNLSGSSESQIRFNPHKNAPRGTSIHVMPGGPDVVRGLPGDVIFDEAAYAEDAEAFYNATWPTVQWGHSFIVISTVGAPGSWFENECSRAEAGKSPFKLWYCPISRAIEQGLADLLPGPHLKLPKGPERNAALVKSLKEGMSDDLYAQEYECIPRGLGGLITMDDYDKQALFEVAKHTRELPRHVGELFVGIDLAFTGDETSIWINEKVYDESASEEYRDCYRPVVHNSWKGLPPRAIASILGEYLEHPNISKVVVDQGGPGYVLALDLQRKFGDIVEPLAVTNAIKAEAYERVKWFLQSDRLGLPKDRPDIRKEFLAVMRKTTPKGSITYEGRTAEGHGDKFASCAYALFAATHDFESILLDAK